MDRLRLPAAPENPDDLRRGRDPGPQGSDCQVLQGLVGRSQQVEPGTNTLKHFCCNCQLHTYLYYVDILMHLSDLYIVKFAPPVANLNGTTAEIYGAIVCSK